MMLKNLKISIDGINFVDLPYADIDLFKTDPIDYIAKKLCVEKAVYKKYLEIHDDQSILQCHASTKKGSRCKLPINGSDGPPSIKAFEKLIGGYCKLHGG